MKQDDIQAVLKDGQITLSMFGCSDYEREFQISQGQMDQWVTQYNVPSHLIPDPPSPANARGKAIKRVSVLLPQSQEIEYICTKPAIDENPNPGSFYAIYLKSTDIKEALKPKVQIGTIRFYEDRFDGETVEDLSSIAQFKGYQSLHQTKINDICQDIVDEAVIKLNHWFDYYRSHTRETFYQIANKFGHDNGIPLLPCGGKTFFVLDAFKDTLQSLEKLYDRLDRELGIKRHFYTYEVSSNQGDRTFENAQQSAVLSLEKELNALKKNIDDFFGEDDKKPSENAIAKKQKKVQDMRNRIKLFSALLKDEVKELEASLEDIETYLMVGGDIPQVQPKVQLIKDRDTDALDEFEEYQEPESTEDEDVELDFAFLEL